MFVTFSIGSRSVFRPSADHDGVNCFYVIDRGLTTLTTIGRVAGFFSRAREYFSNQAHRDSIEWAILPYDNSGAFSKGGDFGSMIASGTGEFGGLLTGGSGRTESSDTTCRCSGSGPSSRPSSPMPIFPRPSTMFVSFFRFILSYL
jgi:hypothetical protein